MAEPTTATVCDHCGAPLKGAGKRTIVTCGFCGREQSLSPPPPDDDERDEDAPDSERWEEDDSADDEDAQEAVDDDDVPFDVDECIVLLHQHIEEAELEYDASDMVIELDDENTDDDRVYLYLKDEEGDVLDYFFVDRDDGAIEVYDYETERWDEA